MEIVEELGKARVETGLEEERGEMKVPGGGKERLVEVGDGHLLHDARVGEDVAFAAVRQQDGYPGGSLGAASDMGGIEAGLGQAGEGDVCHGVVSQEGCEADTGAEKGEVVGKDGGGAAEGHAEAGGQNFDLDWDLLGKAGHDEIKVGFADDGDVERLDGGGGRGRPSVSQGDATPERWYVETEALPRMLRAESGGSA